jgi:aminopeptidase N
MLDAQNAPAAPSLIRREDYRPPDFLVHEVRLDFSLAPEATIVTATLHLERNGVHDRPLVLDGDELELMGVSIDATKLGKRGYKLSDQSLTIPDCPDMFTLEVKTRINPAANSKLMGLYVSGGNFCTQCEAEGFRRITFFPDRPDVLARYTVRMEGDKAAYPVLLSNGNLAESGDLTKGRHFAIWHDPFPKPCYLFALVAGDLHANRDQFTTMSGRPVDLAIWVAKADLPKTEHAMQALKDSMLWDERVYGREYDLDQFNIVAVADFNFGAMENKSLNVFNSRYVLVDPETATDVDYDNVAGVVAHEYFHNWSGNRITCRDWFQLSLKEGFTVFRDQCFSADHGSAAVKRIEDVRMLRAGQFPEDSGPLAHPIRPESYLEISNFYTATIYNKGAEVIRMMHTIVGPDRFRKGSDLYFDRHDGEAATCEDFVKAIEDGAGIDLAQFRHWYSVAGTPHVKAQLAHDAVSGTASLTLGQHTPDTPGQTDKPPLAIPLRFALIDRTTGSHKGEQLELLTDAKTTLSFPGFAQPPVLSINRNFAAPIAVETNRSADDLAFLSAHDDDPFARYEAMQQLMVDRVVQAVSSGAPEFGPVVAAVRKLLENNSFDPAAVAETVLLPSEAYLGDQMLVVDPDAIFAARERLRHTLADALEDHWRALYARFAPEPYIYAPAAKGARRIRNIALGYLAAADEKAAAGLAFRQFETADNMTDRNAALVTLANSNADERVAALDIFYNRYRDQALVLDKWFSTQAVSIRDDTVETVQELRAHPDFTLRNPNRVHALIGAFGANQRSFHRADGAGYRLFTDAIIALDPMNPQTAAKLVPRLGRWSRFDSVRQGLMKAQLERILGVESLSKDVFEQASKSLAGPGAS